MILGTSSQAHAYDPSDYMETRLNTHIKTLCNLNATWDRLLFFFEKRKHVRFSEILLILFEI